MKAIGIIGYKNSGKTRLVIELVREFCNRGLKIATVKHAHHEFDIDQPGKDSYLHRLAGAQEVIISSSRRFAHISEIKDQEPSLRELLSRLGNIDLVIIEGHKYKNYPKLEIRRHGVEHLKFSKDDKSIVGIISDYKLIDSLPVLKRDDVKVIADFVLEASMDV
ncbi:MAG: molybdopterin-guanine dinucleotide biosynthesis protein B [Pseudomonadota bacterium]|nr:molybdopterin-guanine dinucleotide biosynthesis protein B [Pseudomonadota bacterium]